MRNNWDQCQPIVESLGLCDLTHGRTCDFEHINLGYAKRDTLAQKEELRGDKAKAQSAREPGQKRLEIQIWKQEAEYELTTQIWTDRVNLALNRVRDPKPKELNMGEESTTESLIKELRTV